jgi:hypothetical protein
MLGAEVAKVTIDFGVSAVSPGTPGMSPEAIPMNEQSGQARGLTGLTGSRADLGMVEPIPATPPRRGSRSAVP